MHANNNTALTTTTTTSLATTTTTAHHGGARVRPPRRPDIVLDEDQWTEAIEAIIERDYFPEIPKAQSKLEWMDAVQSGDPARIRQAQRNIAQRRAGMRTPHGGGGMPSARPAAASDTPWLTTTATPWRLDTGVSQGGLAEDVTGGGTMPPPQRLDAFLQQHTSEDNASFSTIVQSEAAVRAQRRALLTQTPDASANHHQRITDGYGSTGQPTMALAPPPANPHNRSLHPGDPNARPELMLSTAELAARVAGPPKQIRASNTRFVASSSSTATMPPPPARDGPAHPAGDRPAPEPQHGDGRATYNYLDTPTMTPGHLGGAPMMTWGDIEGTPLRLVDDLDDGLPDVADAQGRRFRMPEVRSRETLARRMATGGGGARGGAIAGVATGRPGSTKGLSTAGRRLASSLRGPTSSYRHATPASIRGIDSQLRASYRSSSALRGGVSPHATTGTPSLRGTPSVQKRGRATPGVVSGMVKKKKHPSKGGSGVGGGAGEGGGGKGSPAHVTDDLLQL